MRSAVFTFYEFTPEGRFLCARTVGETIKELESNLDRLGIAADIKPLRDPRGPLPDMVGVACRVIMQGRSWCVALDTVFPGGYKEPLLTARPHGGLATAFALAEACAEFFEEGIAASFRSTGSKRRRRRRSLGKCSGHTRPRTRER